MMKPVVVLFSKWNIFSDANPRHSIDGISQNTCKLLFSTLLNENFQILHQNKKYETHLSICENDLEYIPTFYNTINTKIHVRSNKNSGMEIEEHIRFYFNNECKKVLLLFSNVYNLTCENIETIFNALPLENEKIIIGVDRRDTLCYIALNAPKIDVFSELDFEDLTGEYLIKKLAVENTEILLMDDTCICYDLSDVKSIYNKYRFIQSKYHSNYIYNLFNHLNENYRSILQS